MTDTEAAATQRELLDREAKAWTRMWEQVERIPADERQRPGVIGDWSVQDLVWHCAEWDRFCARHLDLMRAGPWTDPFAHEPEAYWDRVNQEIADRSKTMAWADVEAGTASAREQVRTAIATFDTVGDVATEWFAGETFDHYDEHAAHIAAAADRAAG